VKEFQAESDGMLAKQYWHRGIMTEALDTILQFGLHKMALNRVTGLVTPENVASIKLIEKFGYREEGLLREYRFFEGKFYDLKIFSLLKKDYIK